MKKTTWISFCLFIFLSWLPCVSWALDPPFDDTTGALKSTEVVPGKQIALWIVSNTDGNRWFSRENNSDKKRSSIMTDYCIFTVEATENGDGIVLKRKVDSKYMKKTTAIEWTENKSEACAFEVVNPKNNFNYDAVNLNPAPAWDPDYANYLVRFVFEGTTNFLNSDVQAGFATGIGPWSAFFVYDVAAGLRAEAIEAFNEILEEAKRYPVGEGLGQYQDPENKFGALLEEALSKDPNTMEIEEMEALTAQLKALIPALVLNMPKAGRFYRLKNSWNDKYIASSGIVNEDQSVAMVSEKDGVATVYYLTEDYRLINSMVLGIERNYVASAEGGVFTIEAHPEVLGTYTVSDLEHDNSTLYALADHLDWADYDYRENSHCSWILEEVTDPAEQPVLVKEFEGAYATLSAPVALNVPEGLEVYTVEGVLADKNELQTALFADKIIPAGCPVLLKRTGMQKDFTFTFAQGGNEAECILVPNYVAAVLPEDVNAYALQNGEQGFCFYQLASERKITAHSAYLVAEDTDIKFFYLDQETTGVGQVSSENGLDEEYYDLLGRRVQKPTKGIYVTKSGKKVMF